MWIDTSYRLHGAFMFLVLCTATYADDVENTSVQRNGSTTGVVAGTVSGILLLGAAFVVVVVCCCCRRGSTTHGRVIQTTQHFTATRVITYPATLPASNNTAYQTEYPQTFHPNQANLAPSAGYPQATAGHPTQTAGYPSPPFPNPNQPSGHPQQSSFQQQPPPGYHSQMTGIPPQPSGYPQQPSGYPAPLPGYPSQQTEKLSQA